MRAAGPAVMVARQRRGACAAPVRLVGPASRLGQGLTVRAVMPDDAAIRLRGARRPGGRRPHVGVRRVIGRPNPR